MTFVQELKSLMGKMFFSMFDIRSCAKTLENVNDGEQVSFYTGIEKLEICGTLNRFIEKD